MKKILVTGCGGFIGSNFVNRHLKSFKVIGIDNLSRKSSKNNIKKFVKNNFDFVGDNFAYEARSIHYNKDKKKQKKGIYGKASIEDVRELKDEGIETEMIPWIEDKEN